MDMLKRLQPWQRFSLVSLHLLWTHHRTLSVTTAAFTNNHSSQHRYTTSSTSLDMSKLSADNLLDACILPLSSDAHKGSSGRVGVLGGSERFTGAPYYAGMACLHVGSDLAYIFCAEEASLAIKSYSPELMVAPVYSAKEFNKHVHSNDDDELVE